MILKLLFIPLFLKMSRAQRKQTPVIIFEEEVEEKVDYDWRNMMQAIAAENHSVSIGDLSRLRKEFPEENFETMLEYSSALNAEQEYYVDEREQDEVQISREADELQEKLNIVETRVKSNKTFTEKFKEDNKISDTESIASSASSAAKKKKKGIVVKNKPKEDEDIKVDANGKAKTFRAFAITDWKRNIDVYKSIIDTLGQRMRYILLANEVAPNPKPGTNGKHWQGFLYFANPRTEKSVRAMTDGAHVEPCYGDSKSNINYCRKGSQSHDEWVAKKEKGPNWGKNFSLAFEHGEEPTPGKRTDMEEMWDAIKKKQISTPADIIDANPGLYFRYAKNMENALKLTPDRLLKRTWKSEIICYFGTGGVGKSNECVFDYAKRFSGDDLSGLTPSQILDKYTTCLDWISLCGDKNSPFITAYTGKDFVIFDEFNPDKISTAEWLRLTDRKPYEFNSKNGSVNFNPKVIYFTANLSPELWWGGWSDQVERRFTDIAQINSKAKCEDFKPKMRVITKENPLDMSGVETPYIRIKERVEAKPASLFEAKDEREAPSVDISAIKIVEPIELPKNIHTAAGMKAVAAIMDKSKKEARDIIESQNEEARDKIAKKKRALIVKQ